MAWGHEVSLGIAARVMVHDAPPVYEPFRSSWVRWVREANFTCGSCLAVTSMGIIRAGRQRPTNEMCSSLYCWKFQLHLAFSRTLRAFLIEYVPA